MVMPWLPAASSSRFRMKRQRMPRSSLTPNRLMRAHRSKIHHLSRLLSKAEVSFEPSVLKEHAGDKWFASHLPDVVVLPRSTKSVSKLLQFAHKNRVPVTPRGGGYGYVG